MKKKECSRVQISNTLKFISKSVSVLKLKKQILVCEKALNLACETWKK